MLALANVQIPSREIPGLCSPSTPLSREIHYSPVQFINRLARPTKPAVAAVVVVILQGVALGDRALDHAAELPHCPRADAALGSAHYKKTARVQLHPHQLCQRPRAPLLPALRLSAAPASPASPSSWQLPSGERAGQGTWSSE